MSLRNSTKKNLRKVAIVAAIVGVGAGIAAPATISSFSASQVGHVNVQTATLNVALGDDAGSNNTFNLNFGNLKPGEVQHQSFYVKNTGSIAAVAKLGQPITPTAFHGGGAGLDLSKLSAGISGITSLTPVTSLPSSFGLGVVQPGETKKFTLDIALDQSAGNEWQGVTLGASATVTLDQQ